MGITEGLAQDNEAPPQLEHNHSKMVKINSATETGPNIPLDCVNLRGRVFFLAGKGMSIAQLVGDYLLS